MHLSPTTHVLARAIIIHKDHILLCRTIGLNYNFYFTPGGHIEPTAIHPQLVQRQK